MEAKIKNNFITHDDVVQVAYRVIMQKLEGFPMECEKDDSGITAQEVVALVDPEDIIGPAKLLAKSIETILYNKIAEARKLKAEGVELKCNPGVFRA